MIAFATIVGVLVARRTLRQAEKTAQESEELTKDMRQLTKEMSNMTKAVATMAEATTLQAEAFLRPSIALDCRWNNPTQINMRLQNVGPGPALNVWCFVDHEKLRPPYPKSVRLNVLSSGKTHDQNIETEACEAKDCPIEARYQDIRGTWWKVRQYMIGKNWHLGGPVKLEGNDLNNWIALYAVAI